MRTSKFELVRKDIEVNPVSGVKVHFTLEDARRLLGITSKSEQALKNRIERFTEEQHKQAHDECDLMSIAHRQVDEECRTFLRTLAKKILNIDKIEPTTMEEFSKTMFE
jgi:hypothetical protein